MLTGIFKHTRSRAAVSLVARQRTPAFSDSQLQQHSGDPTLKDRVQPQLNFQWQSMVWSPHHLMFVATASSGAQVAWSRNGIVWYTQTIAGAPTFTDITYSPELRRFILLRFNSATIYHSQNGINWLTASGSASTTWSCIGYSPFLQRFVCLNTSTSAQYSSDGVNWTGASCISAAWQSACWSQELKMFAAVANTGATRYQFSFDGINWINTGSSFDNTWVMKHVIWVQELGRFVAVGDANSSASTFYSTDGLRWRSGASIGGTNGSFLNMSRVIWMPERRMLVGIGNTAGGSGNLSISTDGINWKLVNIRTLISTAWTAAAYSPTLKRIIALSSTASNGGVIALIS